MAIVAPEGAGDADAVEHFAYRIRQLVDPVVRQAVTDLLEGRPVVSRDGEIEISWAWRLEPASIEIYVRRPSAPYIARIEIRAEAQDDDPRIPEPVPDCWRDAGGPDLVWQLFNCRIPLLRSRSN